jgi:hypothetical protein
MRTSKLRLKAEELRKRTRAAKNQKTAQALVERFIDEVMTDRRRRVTPDIEQEVLAAHKNGLKLPELEDKFLLSAPTLRRILSQRSEEI